MRYILLIIAAITTIFSATAEEFKMEYNTEVGIIAGSGTFTPFYMMNNQGGVVPSEPNSGYFRAGVTKNFDPDKKITYSFGMELTGGVNTDANIYLQQAYFDLHLNSWSIFAGARDEYSMLWDNELTSGSMLWSGNSRPIPQVYIGLPEFTKVPGTNGWLLVRLGVSYGWYTDYNYQLDMRGENDMYTKGLLYHRKNLLFKFGKPNNPFYGIIGIDMAAQFGGVVNSVKQQDGSYSSVDFPNGIKEYFKVLVPLSGDESSPQIDQVNVSGNHLGIYILTAGYDNDKIDAKIYHEHYFDDHSGMIFKNKFDGLWGISMRLKKSYGIEGVLFEVMNATNQSGPFLYDTNSIIPVQVSAGDNYYGHLLYNGWTQRGHTSGTPFITSPLYNNDGYLGFSNTLSRAFHFGVDGTIYDGVRYKLLLSYQNGWGTPYVPFTSKTNQFSSMIEISYKSPIIRDWELGLSCGVDNGTLYGDNTAVGITAKRSGSLVPWDKVKR